VERIKIDREMKEWVARNVAGVAQLRKPAIWRAPAVLNITLQFAGTGNVEEPLSYNSVFECVSQATQQSIRSVAATGLLAVPFKTGNGNRGDGGVRAMQRSSVRVRAVSMMRQTDRPGLTWQDGSNDSILAQMDTRVHRSSVEDPCDVNKHTDEQTRARSKHETTGEMKRTWTTTGKDRPTNDATGR